MKHKMKKKKSCCIISRTHQKWFLQKLDWRLWIGFIWLKKGTSGINFHVQEGNSMSSRGTITFPRRNLLRGVICFIRHRKHRPHCGDQSVSSVRRNNRCLLWEPYETLKYTLLALHTVYSVKADSTCDNYCFKGVNTPHRIFLYKNFHNIKTAVIKTKMGSAARSLGASDLEDSTDAFLLVMNRLPRPLNYRHLIRLQKCKKMQSS
jgi:hypothetical protein